MSKLNPTPSKDGVDRVDLRVTHRVSRAEIVGILADYATDVADLDTDELSPTQVLAVAREDLRFNGALVSSDRAPTADQYAWAERQVFKVWPVTS